MIAPHGKGAIIPQLDTVELSTKICPSSMLSADAPYVALQVQSALNGDSSSLQHILFPVDPVSVGRPMVISTVASHNATSTTKALATSPLHDSTAVFFHYQSQSSSKPHIASSSVVIPHEETHVLGQRLQSGPFCMHGYNCGSLPKVCDMDSESEWKDCDVTASDSAISYTAVLSSKPSGKYNSSNTRSTTATHSFDKPTALEVTSSRFEDGLGPVQAGESLVLQRRGKLNRENDQDKNDDSVMTGLEDEMAPQMDINGPQDEMANASSSNGRKNLKLVEMFMGGLMVGVLGSYVLLV